jgi:hypothetical protein
MAANEINPNQNESFISNTSNSSLITVKRRPLAASIILMNLRVLVIEDHIIHRTLLVEQLTVQMGIPESNITCCFDGLDAIKEIEANIYDHVG